MAPTLSSLVLKIQIGEDEEYEKVIKLLVADNAVSSVSIFNFNNKGNC
jgi:hypothetical protein